MVVVVVASRCGGGGPVTTAASAACRSPLKVGGRGGVPDNGGACRPPPVCRLPPAACRPPPGPTAGATACRACCLTSCCRHRASLAGRVVQVVWAGRATMWAALRKGGRVVRFIWQQVGEVKEVGAGVSHSHTQQPGGGDGQVSPLC